jgi:hypothetical protein|tara:strand:+ start:114 stop:254 length:141 start_codon:yes stop_codon:yes gene_type:complete
MIEQVLGAIGALLIFSVISIGATFFIASAFFGKPKCEITSQEYKDQ